MEPNWNHLNLVQSKIGKGLETRSNPIFPLTSIPHQNLGFPMNCKSGLHYWCPFTRARTWTFSPANRKKKKQRNVGKSNDTARITMSCSRAANRRYWQFLFPTIKKRRKKTQISCLKCMFVWVCARENNLGGFSSPYVDYFRRKSELD